MIKFNKSYLIQQQFVIQTFCVQPEILQDYQFYPIIHVRNIDQWRKCISNIKLNLNCYQKFFQQLNTMNNTTLILNRVCPFAERALITLQEKQVPFTIRQVQFTNKEPFWTQTYRKAFAHDPKSDGKVPILIEGERILTQSDLISWYVAEKYSTGTKLIPDDPFDKLKLRFFTQSHGKVIGAFYGFKGYKNKSKEDQEKQLESLNKILGELNDAIVLPFALGNDFTMADILIYPWFPRWCALQKHVGITISEKFEKIHKWIKNIKERDSIKKITQPNEYYIEGYKGYFE